MWKPKTFSNFEWCGGWNNGVVGSWTTWFLDFDKRGAWNKCGGAKFGPFLISVVAEKTALWVENYQTINCPDVTSIRERRVHTKNRGSMNSSPNRVQSIYPILIHSNHVLNSLLIIYNNLCMCWKEGPWIFLTELSLTQFGRPGDDQQNFIRGSSNG